MDAEAQSSEANGRDAREQEAGGTSGLASSQSRITDHGVGRGETAKRFALCLTYARGSGVIDKRSHRVRAKNKSREGRGRDSSPLLFCLRRGAF